MRYAALLRGVSPMNCKMPELKIALEKAGFTNVKTVISSGNALFDGPAKSNATIEREVEAALTRHLGKSFPTIIRRVDELRNLIESKPFAKAPKNARCVVTFFKTSKTLKIPVTKGEATIFAADGLEAFSHYVPQPGNPVFMVLLEKTFGKEITTRTLGTVEKLAK
ncbi:MAG: DUF1697 domain-containing protein [Archangium sp.]